MAQYSASMIYLDGNRRSEFTSFDNEEDAKEFYEIAINYAVNNNLRYDLLITKNGLDWKKATSEAR